MELKEAVTLRLMLVMTDIDGDVESDSDTEDDVVNNSDSEY